MARAIDDCLAAIDALDPSCHTLVHAFSVQFLDAVVDVRAEADSLLARLVSWFAPDGSVLVEGGTDDERMRPLDFAPFPDRPARAGLAAAVVDADLDRLAARQQDDGGWPVEWATFSPVSTLEWRGHLTMRALAILERNGRLAR